MKQSIIIFQGDFRLAGAEVVGVNLAISFYRLGYDVTVVVLKKRGSLLERLPNGVNVDVLNSRLIFSLFKFRKYLKSSCNKNYLISTIRNLNILVSLSLPHSRSIKVIFSEQNTYRQFKKISFKTYILYKLYRVLIPFAYKKADWIIANSRDTREDIISISSSFQKNISVIGNPVINDVLKPTNLINNHVENDNTLKVLSIGRLHPQKDYKLALQCIYQLKSSFPKLKYTIIGQGLLRDYLIKYGESLGLSYETDWEIISPVSNPSIFFNSCDIFFLSSAWEGFGNVLVEAMYFGLTPVVASCPGGPRDIIGSQYGYFSPDRDIATVCKYLKKALECPISKQLLKMRALEYHSDVIAKKYLKHTW